MNSAISFKVEVKAGEKQFRRIRVNSFEEFLKNVVVFCDGCDAKELVFQYIDDENEWVTFDSEEEFEEIREMKKQPIRARIHCKRSCSKKCPGNMNGKFVDKNDPLGTIISGIHQFLNSANCENMKSGKKCRFGRNRNPFQFGYPCFGGIGKPRCQGFGRRRPNFAHYNIVCDGCGKRDWFGRRFKCTDCEFHPGYDLCGKCMMMGKHEHDSQHKFREIPMKPVFAKYWQCLPGGTCSKNKNDKEEEEKKVEINTEDVEEETEGEGVVEEEEEEESIEIKEKVEVLVKSEVSVPEEEKKEEVVTFKKQLSILGLMGFHNYKKNLELLEKHNGDTQRVVRELLQM